MFAWIAPVGDHRDEGSLRGMDFMRLLRSLEEFVYELVSWLIFYPRTLWRSSVHPQRMMTYAESELVDKEEDQFSDTISPPLFLWLTLFFAHLLEAKLIHTTSLTKYSLIATDTNLLIFRAVLFSIFPLLMAARVLTRQGIRIDRRTLKAPFYSQCFPSASFALVSEIAFMMTRHHRPAIQIAGVVVAILAVVWYLLVEARWLSAQLQVTWWRGLGTAVITFAVGSVIVLTLLVVVAIGLTR